jgi:hypothetical protein
MDTDNIPLKSVSKLFLCRPSYSTLLRWVTVGLRVNDKRIVLDSFREGGRIYVNVHVVEAWKKAISKPRFRSDPDGYRRKDDGAAKRR